MAMVMIVRTQEDVKVIALVGGVDRGCGHLSCSIITIVVRLLLASNIFEIIQFVMVCVSLRARTYTSSSVLMSPILI